MYEIIVRNHCHYYSSIGFAEEIESIRKCNTIGTPKELQKLFCSSIVQSHNLVNFAHYDLDKSISISTWTETIPGSAKGWYFVLPNLTIDGKKGIAIKLHHGLTIQWDGRLLWHCTAMEDVGESNNVFGTFFASK